MTIHPYTVGLLGVLLFVGCTPHRSSTGSEELSEGSDAVTPFDKAEDAVAFVKAYEGSAEDFELPIADSLADPLGANMAIITDAILEKGFMPDGFEEREGYRLYKYKSFE